MGGRTEQARRSKNFVTNNIGTTMATASKRDSGEGPRDRRHKEAASATKEQVEEWPRSPRRAARARRYAMKKQTGDEVDGRHVDDHHDDARRGESQVNDSLSAGDPFARWPRK